MAPCRGLALAVICFHQFTLSSADTPDNVSSRLSIHIPHNLYKSDGYDHREALFGIPPFGGSIAQKVYYADSDLCDPTVNTRIGFPTRDKDDTGKQAPWESPYILMVDRGGCTFVQKVRNAQRSGAAGVIIADNSCLCGDAECLEMNRDIQCQNAEPIMADDGSGSDVTVPSFLMFKHDADKVKDTVRDGTLVQLEMAWALPSPDDRVEYDLWTVPTEHVSREFQKSFMNLAKALGDRAYFTPHMYIYDGIKSGCQGREGENQCYTLCTNNGRYCATDPDSNLDEGISGADVVIESLRRICIWKHYGENDGIGLRWWEYVAEFMERCDTEDIFNDEACYNDVMKKVKIDHLTIEQCMKDSGGVDRDQVNTFLDTELDAQEKRGVVVLPTAFVNTAAIRGALSIESVFTAICAGYLDGTRPTVCDCTSCPDIHDCAGNDGMCASKQKNKGVPMHTFVLALFGVAGLVAFGGFYYYRKSQADMREQVRGILAEYMPLEDQDGGMAGDINPATEFAKRAGQTLIDS